MLYENWKSDADLDIHFARDNLVQLLADFDQRLDGALELHRLSMVSQPAA